MLLVLSLQVQSGSTTKLQLARLSGIVNWGHVVTLFTQKHLPKISYCWLGPCVQPQLNRLVKWHALVRVEYVRIFTTGSFNFRNLALFVCSTDQTGTTRATTSACEIRCTFNLNFSLKIRPDPSVRVSVRPLSYLHVRLTLEPLYVVCIVFGRR